MLFINLFGGGKEGGRWEVVGSREREREGKYHQMEYGAKKDFAYRSILSI